MSTHLLLHRREGTIFDLPVSTGSNFGSTSELGVWDNDWSHIRTFGTADDPYFLLYKQSTGKVFTMPIHSVNDFGIATPAGTWETDWKLMTPFSAGGKDFVLLYRNSGAAFYLELLPGPAFSPTAALATLEGDWAHIEFVEVSGQPFFLMVKKDGMAYAARIHYGRQTVGTLHQSAGVIVDKPVQLGKWETDWALIRAFRVEGSTSLLFYRTTGEIFSSLVELGGGPLTPIEQRPLAVRGTSAGGTWETDWAEIAAFQINDLTFGIDRIDIVDQKADSDHADNDGLNIAWSIVKAKTKEQHSFSKDILIPGVLRSGQSVSGRFATDPFKLSDGDILTLSVLLSNFGSSDPGQEFTQVVQMGKKFYDYALPILGSIAFTVMGDPGGPFDGFKKGKDISDAMDWAIQGLSDLGDTLGVHVGPPNCNGVVMTYTWLYRSSELPTLIGVSGSQSIAGPSKDRCQTPSTTITWSIQRA